MARKLSAKQQRVLQKYPKIFDFDDLPSEVQTELTHINNYETLWQDATRFLSDQYHMKLYGKA